MTQLFVQTVPRHAGWLLVGPPAATSLAPQQDITVTFADGTSVVVPAGTPAALLGGGTTWDRTKEVVVGYVLAGSGTLLACPEAQLSTLGTDYAPLVRVLADSVQVYQTQQAGGGASLAVDHAGVLVGTRPTLNLIDGTGATLTVADNSAANRVDVTVAATGGSGAGIAVRAVSNAPQTITTTNATALNLQVTTFDQGTATAQHSATVNNTRLTCRDAGVYLVLGFVFFAYDSSGVRGAAFLMNGTTWSEIQAMMQTTTDPIGLNLPGVFVSDLYSLTVGDYLELTAFQDSGGDLDIEQAVLQWVKVA